MTVVKRENSSEEPQNQLSIHRKATDGVLFLALISVSALALAVVTVITPVVLAISSIMGLMRSGKPESNWRAASA